MQLREPTTQRKAYRKPIFHYCLSKCRLLSAQEKRLYIPLAPFLCFFEEEFARDLEQH